MNTFGNIYRLTSFGESHGPAMGGVIDGIPAGTVFNMQALREEVARRRPGQSTLVSARSEADEVRFLSGLMAYDGDSGEMSPFDDSVPVAVALGTPVGFIIENTDARGKDYDALRHVYRPSHADYAWDARYGIRDWRGGGRSSGRETVSRVVAGAFARQILSAHGISIVSCIRSLGGEANPGEEEICRIINDARNSSDSVGGIVGCTVSGMPAGIGEPVFGKLQQMLAGAILSIGGVKGFEYGMGFAGTSMRGNEAADEFVAGAAGGVRTVSNHSGGIQGGISNGADIVFNAAVKPTPTIAQPLRTVDDTGKEMTLKAAGRHDPSIVIRIRPVIEAMTAMVVLDAILMRSIDLSALSS